MILINPFVFGAAPIGPVGTPLPVALRSGLTDWFGMDGSALNSVDASRSGSLMGKGYVDFASSAQSFVADRATITTAVDGVLVTATGADPNFYRNDIAPTFNGGVFRYMHIRIKRLGGTTWDGTLFYRTGNHWFDGGYWGSLPDPTHGVIDGVWYTLVYDMWNLGAGGLDWKNNTIVGLRLDLGANAGDNFEIASIHASTSPVTDASNYTYEAGAINGMRFKGNDDYWVALPNSFAGNTFSMACWVTGTGPVFTRGSDTSSGWGVSLSDDGTNALCSIVTTIPGAVNYQASQAHHATDMSIPRLYVITFDNTAKLVGVSANGAPRTLVATGQNLRGTDNVYIGGSHLGILSSPWSGRVGSVEEVGFWNRALNDAEIAQLWNGGAGYSYQTL